MLQLLCAHVIGARVMNPDAVQHINLKIFVADAAAISAAPDGVIISNVNPAQIDGVSRRFEGKFAGPVLRLWEPIVMQPMRQAA